MSPTSCQTAPPRASRNVSRQSRSETIAKPSRGRQHFFGFPVRQPALKAGFSNDFNTQAISNHFLPPYGAAAAITPCAPWPKLPGRQAVALVATIRSLHGQGGECAHDRVFPFALAAHRVWRRRAGQ